eukprot:scaffold93714_cov49-Attheya_sp.AAC.1
MSEALGNPVVISVFVDADHAVEAATYGSEFVAARIAVEMAEGLLYKLRMFGIPVELPINIFGDNHSVVNSSSRLEARLTKKHLGICFHR